VTGCAYSRNQLRPFVDSNIGNIVKGKLIKNMRILQVSESHPDYLFEEKSVKFSLMIVPINKRKVKRIPLARNSLICLNIF
jgi:hypothetical protein